MDRCNHVIKLKPSKDHSILNPQKWNCGTCGTTESVWACLHCSNVACGRYIEEHALKHYQETKHPLTLDVNEMYVFCYECDEYVINDNAAGDVKILRTCLSAIKTQTFRDISRSHHRMLRSHSSTSGLGSWNDKSQRDEDLAYTAVWFRRYYMLARAFTAWKMSTPSLAKKKAVVKKSTEKQVSKPTRISERKKSTVLSGVTGLRNLGNTCYMNSVLQVLSNLQEFREHFLQQSSLYVPGATTALTSPPGSTDTSPRASTSQQLVRQTTMECFQHVSESCGKGGLNGGSSTLSVIKSNKARSPVKPRSGKRRSLPVAAESTSQKVSLCRELHTLLRVMWSGKWAMVSPHKMLQSVWSVIPFFKGYTQQDAQEFLSEFLGKVQGELDKCKVKSITMTTDLAHNQDIIDNIFQGELVSEVRCLKCGQMSETREPFMDLSLDFPSRYHWHKKKNRVCTTSCHVKEMLSCFTDVEKLEGKIYSCGKCNRQHNYFPSRPQVLTEAEKRFRVCKLPRVLRLHLKRFTWAGRNHRGKIPVQVEFDEQLDMSEFRASDDSDDSSVYRLVGVVMHHGRGFGSGHYTSYCYNNEAVKSSKSTSECWVHCNDAKMTLCKFEDVQKAQAYILIYVHKDYQYTPDPKLLGPMEEQRSFFVEQADDDISFNFKNSSIPRFVELKRKLAQDQKGRSQLKRRKSNIW